MTANKQPTHPFSGCIDLAQPRLGSQVVFANDEFFAAKERLIDPRDPVFIADKYDDHGKWMDGWETRRRREPGHDHCIVRLGVRGTPKGFDVDTAHFTGNYAPEVSIEGCVSEKSEPGDDAGWREVLPRTPLNGDSHHYLGVSEECLCTHLRVHIYPDGGIARLRVYGAVQPDWESLAALDRIDLLALENGGRALACNDQHFGSMHNLNAPGRGVNMGDGWETARRRGPGFDWVVMALGSTGVVDGIEIDTAHFKGNYPDRASIQAARIENPGGSIDDIIEQSVDWELLLPESKLQMDRQQVFSEVRELGPITHVRLNIFPDGGVSRLRLFGRMADG